MCEGGGEGFRKEADPERLLRFIVYFLIFYCSFLVSLKGDSDSLWIFNFLYEKNVAEIPVPLWSENLDCESHINKETAFS